MDLFLLCSHLAHPLLQFSQHPSLTLFKLFKLITLLLLLLLILLMVVLFALILLVLLLLPVLGLTVRTILELKLGCMSFLDFLPNVDIGTGCGGGVGVVEDNLGTDVAFTSADFDGGVSCFGEFDGDVSFDLCLYPVNTGLRNPSSLLSRQNLVSFLSLPNLSNVGLALALMLDSE